MHVEIRAGGPAGRPIVDNEFFSTVPDLNLE